MSFDIDKDEYWEAIASGNYKWIWSAIEDLIAQNKKLRELILEAIEEEPEFPDEPPEEMIDALMSGDRDTITYALRLAVKLTKRGITERVKEVLK